MRPLTTLVRLFNESKKYAAINNNNWWQLFKTLTTLYIKSKFSGKDDDIVFHKFPHFEIYAYDFPTLIALYREIFLDQVYTFLPESKEPFIIDCGANIGMAVLFFKTLYPQSEVWAFEPNPNAYALLEKNIAINHLEKVKLFNYALSDVDESIDFYEPNQKGSLNASSKKVSTEKMILVEGKKLSGLLPKRKIDLIKIDIEGDERKVIEDMNESQMLEFVQEFLVEFHSKRNVDDKDDLEAFLSYFTNQGFSYQQRIPVHENQLSEDLIFYFRKVRL